MGARRGNRPATLLASARAMYAVAALAWLLGINLWTTLRFRDDKSRAAAGARRIPEAGLLGLAILGGSPGPFAARRLFRHKTQGAFLHPANADRGNPDRARGRARPPLSACRAGGPRPAFGTSACGVGERRPICRGGISRSPEQAVCGPEAVRQVFAISCGQLTLRFRQTRAGMHSRPTARPFPTPGYPNFRYAVRAGAKRLVSRDAGWARASPGSGTARPCL